LGFGTLTMFNTMRFLALVSLLYSVFMLIAGV
jgi:hypothetical protein